MRTVFYEILRGFLIVIIGGTFGGIVGTVLMLRLLGKI
jgi:hypothetical protein